MHFYVYRRGYASGYISANLNKTIDRIFLISIYLTRISVGEDLLKEFRIMSFAHVRMAPEANNKSAIEVDEFINLLDPSDKIDFP